MADDLPRDNRGVRLDVEKTRDLSFSSWHRTLPSFCFVTDVDFLEYRIVNGTFMLKALFEVKKGYVTDPKYVENNANFKAIKTLAQKAGLPFYHIWYKKDNYEDTTESIKKFLVWDTDKPRSTTVEKSLKEMEDFIKGL